MNTRDRTHDFLAAITIECTKHPFETSADVKLRYGLKGLSFAGTDEV